MALPSTCATTFASIDCASDADYYSFVPPNSGTFTLVASSAVTISLELQDAGGTTLQSDNNFGSGNDAVVTHVLSAGAMYYVVVYPVYQELGDYTLEISGCTSGCGNDPGNDDPGSATPLPGCGSTPASIDCVGDKDFYSLVAPNSGSYTFETTGTTDTYMVLTDGNDQALTFDDDSGSGTNAKIIYTLVGGQTYKVGVNEYQDNATGDYTLVVSGCTASCGADPGNDTGATATVLRSGCGDLTGKAIDCPGDIDFYSWTASDAGTYTFAVTPTSTMRLTLFTAAGAWLGEGPSIDQAMTAGETVHIRIMSQSPSDTPSYTMTISGCSSGGCGNDPGNDTTGTATDLGSSCSTTSAAVDCLGDVDYYAWTAPSTGSFTFETTGTTDTYMSLYNNAGDPITSDDDSGAGSNAKIVYTVGAGQQYYISVAEYLSDATGDYALNISGCSAGGCGSDPGNDTTGTATSLGSSCGTTSARIDCTGDVDFYAFTAPNGGTFTFDVGALSTYNITLYSDTGSLLEGPSGSALAHTLSAGQLVYARVMAGADGNLLDYSLVISGCSAGGCGADPGNDTTGTATDLGTSCATTSAAIDCTGDLDYYAFTAPNTGPFTFETGGTTDTQMWLYDSSGDVKASDDDSGSGTNASITFTLSSGQRYYIAVGEYGGDATGDYTLVVSGCAAGGCGNDPGNNDLGSATPVQGCTPPTQAAIDCVGDVDFYSFVAPRSHEFVIQTTTSTGTDTQLVLYDAAGGIIAADDNSGNGTNAQIVHDLTAGQTYKIQVSESGNDGTGDYSLQIAGCADAGCGADPGNDDFSLATDLGSSCGTTPAAIDCDTDLDFYTFTATADTVYTFVVSSAGGLRFELWVGGQQVGGGTTSTTLPMTPGEPVTIVVARDGGTAPISYDLTISGCSSGGCGADPGNENIAHATDVGSSCINQAANIDCAADIDVYKFTVPTDGIYTYSAAGAKNTYVALMDASGAVIKQTGISIVHAETAGSVRYFQVSPNSTLDAPFAYTLEIAGCASGSCGADPGNDDSGHATDLGTGMGNWPAAIDCPGDVDVYSFTAPGSGSYLLTTTGSTDTWMQLSDQAVIATDDNSGQDTNASVTANLTDGTKYFVAIKEASGTGTGAYVLGIAGSGGGTVYTYLVPATAKVTGLSGTDWRSDLSIVNTKASTALVTFEAWLRDQANPAPTAVTRVLPGGEAFNKTDLLASLFGFGSGTSAAIKITSDNELAVSTRTYNLTGHGTYGQYIRGRELAASFGPGETAYLQGFREDSQARSNLGLVNAAGVTNHITVTFYAADGSQLGAPVTYAVPAQGFVQKTQVLKSVVSQPVELAWAKLTAADGPFVGYLSLIDAASGDPTFRPTMAASTSSTEVIQPGIAKVHGASSTNWVSDLVLLNTTASVQQASLELWVRDDANTSPQTRSLSLAAHECRRLADVLPGLFGVNNGAAAFKITAGPGVIVDARTFNQVASGAYGQYVPSMHRLQGVFSTLSGYFPMVEQDGAFRTNLGLVNGDSGPVDVKISLVDESGTVIGTPLTVHLADRAVTQLDRIVNRFTSDPFAGGYLKLEVPSSFFDHPVHAFVTVVDQKTGDPVYETPVTVQP